MAREKSRSAELLDDAILDFFRIGEQYVEIGKLLYVGEAQHDPVIGVHRLHFVAGQSTQRVLDRESPRRVDARAERGQNADAPIAELVAEPLDRDIPIRRERIGMLFLLLDVTQQILGGESVERRRVFQQLSRRRRRRRVELAQKSTHRPPELDRTPRSVAVPKRHLARLSGRR